MAVVTFDVYAFKSTQIGDSVGTTTAAAFLCRASLLPVRFAMRTVFLRPQVLIVFCLALAVTACGTRPPPNFKGRWKPVNQYAEAPVAIPLYASYVYAASPMDKTLKGLLTRWAQASKRTLSYLHSSDFTLYQPVKDISTTDLDQAITQLNADYAPYGVAISVDAGQIFVRQAQAVEAGATQVPTSP